MNFPPPLGRESGGAHSTGPSSLLDSSMEARGARAGLLVLSWVMALFYLEVLLSFPSPVFSLVSWRKCSHPGSSSAWTVASRTSASGSSAPRCSSASCAQPSCRPAFSAWCRSTRTTARLGLSLLLPRSFRIWLTSPSRCLYHNHFFKKHCLKNICDLKCGYGWGASSLML